MSEDLRRNELDTFEKAVDFKQNELDAFEKHILVDLFGKDEVPGSVNALLKLRGIDLQQQVNKFEEIIKPLMNDKGFVDGCILKELFPKYGEFIPSEPFRLIDVYQNVSDVIKFLLGRV